MTREEAEKEWGRHAGEVLSHDADYQAALEKQRHVGRRVGWAYVVLVASLLAFMSGFYLWRFRFFWAIITYFFLWALAIVAARVIIKYSLKKDHLGELISKARLRYIEQLAGKQM